MKSPLVRLSLLWRFPGWFAELVIIRSSRIRNQVRLLALAGLVGVVAGVGAIVFYVATRAVEHYSLGVVAGCYAEPRPRGEPPMAWLSAEKHPLHLWLLLLVPAVGGLLSGILVFTLAPEAEGHGRDSAIAAYRYHQGRHRSSLPAFSLRVTRLPPRNNHTRAHFVPGALRTATREIGRQSERIALPGGYICCEWSWEALSV
jgi:hypothetical protein